MPEGEREQEFGAFLGHEFRNQPRDQFAQIFGIFCGALKACADFMSPAADDLREDRLLVRKILIKGSDGDGGQIRHGPRVSAS